MRFRDIRRAAVGILLGWQLLLMLASNATAATGTNDTAALIAERLQQMQAVAAWKWIHQRPIEDSVREQQVIERAVTDGLQYRLHADAVERLFSAQIRAAKSIQQHWFEQWSQGDAPISAPDLSTSVRPRLLELGSAITRQWAVNDAPPSRDMIHARLDAIAGLQAADIEQIATALASRAFYDNPSSQIAESGILRIGTTGDYQPFSYLDKSGEYQGVDIELARSLAAALGARPVFVSTSWPTLMQDLDRKRFDVAMSGVSITTQRQQVAAFSAPYHVGGKAAIARCENVGRFDSLTKIDQPGVRVIVNPGGTNERFVRTRLEQAEIVMHPDNRTIFDALANNAADVMITDLIEVRLQSANNPALCPAIDTPLNRQEKGVMTHRHQPLVKRINDWLDAPSTHTLIENSLRKHGAMQH